MTDSSSAMRLRGVVVAGDGRGQRLGFPTANLDLLGQALPPDGIYAAMLTVSGQRFGASASVGTNPTFAGDRPARVEVHVHDAQFDLYGQAVELELVERLRGTRRFDTVEALIEQTRADVERSRLRLHALGLQPQAGDVSPR